MVSRPWRYPMVKVITVAEVGTVRRVLNCFPMCVLKADDAALTLPIASPGSEKSWAPCRVMFWGGLSPRKNSVNQSWATFCGAVPQLTRLTIE